MSTTGTTTRTKTTTAWIKAALQGFHCWPDAPPGRAYLRARHRHLFHVAAEVQVSHDERDVEFHDLGDVIRDWWGPDPREWGAASCEAIAGRLLDHLERQGLRPVRVTVSEDGEAGATITLGEAV